MVRCLRRLLGLAIQIVLLGWFAAGVHEMFHYLVGKSLGIPGSIDFTWGGLGLYQPLVYLGPLENALVGLAGGVGTGLVFGGLWLVSHFQLKASLSEVDNTVSFFLIAAMNLVYAPFDAWHSYPVPLWSLAFVLVLPLVAAGWLYWDELLGWMTEP